MLTCDHAERNQNHASRELSKFSAVRLCLFHRNDSRDGRAPLGADGARVAQKWLWLLWRPTLHFPLIPRRNCTDSPGFKSYSEHRSSARSRSTLLSWGMAYSLYDFAVTPQSAPLQHRIPHAFEAVAALSCLSPLCGSWLT